MKTILLIEPNTLLAQTYTKALEQGGHKVACAADAQSAIHAADSASPDLVILELMLVAHSGIEFLHEFRSYADWQSVPVIINTAVPPTSVAPVRQALTNELGVCEILYKPRTSLSSLIGHVREQLVVVQ